MVRVRPGRALQRPIGPMIFEIHAIAGFCKCSKSIRSSILPFWRIVSMDYTGSFPIIPRALRPFGRGFDQVSALLSKRNPPLVARNNGSLDTALGSRLVVFSTLRLHSGLDGWRRALLQ
jgi:hypothetical protein